MVHDERYVPENWDGDPLQPVRHEWWRTVPMAGELGRVQYLPAEPKSRGAFAVTVTTIIEDRQRRATERMIAANRRGESNGFANGLNWALRHLDRINPQACEELLSAYREENADAPKETGR